MEKLAMILFGVILAIFVLGLLCAVLALPLGDIQPG